VDGDIKIERERGCVVGEREIRRLRMAGIDRELKEIEKLREGRE